MNKIELSEEMISLFWKGYVMSLYLFKVKAGKHVENGIVYKAGDKVRSSHKLTKLFPNKFEFIKELMEKTTQSPASPKIPSPPPGGASDAQKTGIPSSPQSISGGGVLKKEEEHDLEGTVDVTRRFKRAKELGVDVAKGESGYYITDPNDGLLTKKPLKSRKKVAAFLESLVVTEEDED